MVNCYYCEKPLGASRKRGFVEGGQIATFHKPCFAQFRKEEISSQLSEIKAERLNEQAQYGHELEPDREEISIEQELARLSVEACYQRD